VAVPKTKDKKQDKLKKLKSPQMTEAERADRYVYYQKAVQVPEEDVAFINRVYKSAFGEKPRIFREDFCGTALCSCRWVESHPKNVAYGIDLDPDPIAWGTKHNLSQLNDAQRARVHLIEGNALDAGSPPADVIAALNFSYYCFKTRAELVGYFKAAYDNLGERGLFVVDMEGGWEALDEAHEERDEDGFVYVWEQEDFDAITHHVTCKIHFQFEDGSTLEDAFIYDWRIWTLPEIRDCMAEAGFVRTEVYWEGWDDEEEEGDGNFELTEHAENCESWIAYVVGIKPGE